MALQAGAACTAFGKAGRDHQRRVRARLATGIDDRRYRRGRGADGRQIDALRHILDAGMTGLAKQRAMAGIDEMQCALEAGIQHVAHQRGADRTFLIGGADDGDAARRHQRGEIVLFAMHGRLRQ